ncbi:MAG TPA: hypothetical protein DHV42_01720 [Lachnospiraceae bacterium]|jgi:hypothetical protein|nr:hypothetical protein [Lachnospiraceae bacterium]
MCQAAGFLFFSAGFIMLPVPYCRLSEHRRILEYVFATNQGHGAENEKMSVRKMQKIHELVNVYKNGRQNL